MTTTVLKRGAIHLPARFWDMRLETDSKIIEQLKTEGWVASSKAKGQKPTSKG